jgi:hypothetical protein
MRHFHFLRGPLKQAADREKVVNKSNQWRVYAKMEANHHLTNKFALFKNMSIYYKSIG